MKTILATFAVVLLASPASAILIPVHWGFSFDGPPNGHNGHFFAEQAGDGSLSNIQTPFVNNYPAYTLTAFSASSDFALDPMQAELSFTLESVDDTIQFSIVDGAWTETRTNPQLSRSGQATSHYLFLPEGSAGLPLLASMLALAAFARRFI